MSPNRLLVNCEEETYVADPKPWTLDVKKKENGLAPIVTCDALRANVLIDDVTIVAELMVMLLK